MRRSNASRLSRQRGFTLMELLIAAAISVMIGTIAAAALTSASDTAERTSTVMQEINQLDRAWQLIETDLRHVIKPDGRLIRFEGKSLQFIGASSSQVILQFKRNNWVNFSNQLRSDLQLVSYRLDQGTLIRDFVPDINRDPHEIDFEREAIHTVLLSGVEDVQLRFLSQNLISANGESQLKGEDYTRNWLQNWPDVGQQDLTILPLAVEIRLTQKGVGTSVRLFSFAE